MIENEKEQRIVIATASKETPEIVCIYIIHAPLEKKINEARMQVYKDSTLSN